MKIDQAYRVFMAHGAAERLYAPETLKKHEDVFRCWLLPIFQQRDVESISRKDVLDVRQAMLTRGIGVYRQYQIVMTIKLFLGVCRNILKLPCLDPVEIALPQRKAPTVEWLTNEEVERLKEACQVNTRSGLRLRALIEVLLATGMRISEALSLDREPFERGSREVEIRGKGGKRRTVFLSEQAIFWGRKLLSSRTDSMPAVFVTTGYPPRRLARSDISRFFILLRERAGIRKQVTPHLLRHTFCTNLLANGADITHIKELAGHSDIQTTARYYLGVDNDALRKVVGKCLNYEVEQRVA